MGGMVEKFKTWIDTSLTPALSAYRNFMEAKSNLESGNKYDEEKAEQEFKLTYKLLLYSIKEIRKVFEDVEQDPLSNLQNLLKFFDNCRTYKLTDREIEVVKLAAEGKPDRVIANELFISIKTVQTHMAKIFKKVSVNKRIKLFTKLELQYKGK